ncbi:hypothetical protein BQ6471_03016 [Vibrio gazogenes]|nr:hypothetical protein BQ6471_03016 [Vibrio gazogenes]
MGLHLLDHIIIGTNFQSPHLISIIVQSRLHQDIAGIETAYRFTDFHAVHSR